MNKLIKYVAVALISLLIGAASGTVIVTMVIPGVGRILYGSYTIYLDDVPMTSSDLINWSECEAGYEYQFDNLTCHNDGGKAYIISMYVIGLPSDLDIIWAANNTALLPGQKCEAPLILNATDATTTTDFTYDHQFDAHD